MGDEVADHNESIAELLSALAGETQNIFLAPKAITATLSQVAGLLGVESLGARIDFAGVQFEWGTCGTTRLISSEEIAKSVEASVYVSASQTGSQDAAISRTALRILDFLKSLWVNAPRKHCAYDLKAGSAASRLSASLAALGSVSQQIAVVYFDLDNFKELNKQSNQEEGDRAIRVMNAALHRLVAVTGGVAFLNGGDEFVALVPSDDLVSVMASLRKLQLDVQNHSFGSSPGVTIGVTAGICLRTLSQLDVDFAEALDAAENATKDAQTREKRRGKVGFESPETSSSLQSTPTDPHSFFELGISISRCRRYQNRAFGDCRLDIISASVEAVATHDGDMLGIEKAVAEAIDWLGVSVSGSYSEGPLLGAQSQRDPLSSAAIAVAVLHGMAKKFAPLVSAGAPHALEVLVGASGEISVTMDANHAWGAPSMHPRLTIAYGPLWPVRLGTPRIGALIGVQVGFDGFPRTPGGNDLPLDLFSEYVRVDDRPRSGGGLPDFWQVAIAQIVASLGESPSDRVVLWGEQTTQTETYMRLRGAKPWSIDEVASLTELPTEKVSQIADQLKELTVTVSSSRELLKEIYEAFTRMKAVDLQESTSKQQKTKRLPRPMAAAAPVDQSEALVCSTAAMAYPIVIDTLRKSSNVRMRRDDSDTELKDLVAFKLRLTEPSRDSIPDYLLEQKLELELYADRVLLNPQGLIREQLESSGQIESFVSHLATYAGPSKQGRTTRRACLVVPHVPVDGEPRPLGLICVWATPRPTGEDTTALDFVFVWRTVEAFIGLPYSLYGSITLAKDLLGKIQTRLDAHRTVRVELGDLAYVALSLHLGSDRFHMRVAKRIVDLASD